MRRVIVESPFAGDVPANIAYARRALADCLRRGEAPYASHLLYTQEGVLDDNNPAERSIGLEAGFVWGDVAHAVVFYMDRGISRGMAQGMERARARGILIEHRWLDSDSCHQCVGVGASPEAPDGCSSCGGSGRLPKKGPGR